MDITKEMRYVDFKDAEPFLFPEGIKQLKDKSEEIFGYCHRLTIDEFFAIINGDLSLLGNMETPTVLQVYWMKRFEDFTKEFTKICERYTLSPTPEQQQATQGVEPMTPLETMLVFTRDYFGLPSFVEAGKRTIGEYITAKKARYNDLLTQRNYQNIQVRKMKTQKK